MARTLSPATVEVVSGWTTPISLQLLVDGAAADVSAAGDVSLRLFDNRHNLVPFTGTFAPAIAASGMYRFSPEAGDLVDLLSPYTVRVRVTDAVGDVSYYPSGDADVWTVNPEAK